jgi:uncharacterized protein (DUF1778 family)
MNINIAVKVTADESKRIKRAAKFSGQSVADFIKSWTAAGVQACEDDYIIHDGEIIGDRLETAALERVALEALREDDF